MLLWLIQCTLQATVLWDENHRQQIHYFPLQTPSFTCFWKNCWIILWVTPPSFYVNECFATEFSGAAICAFLWGNGPMSIILSCYKVKIENELEGNSKHTMKVPDKHWELFWWHDLSSHSSLQCVLPICRKEQTTKNEQLCSSNVISTHTDSMNTKGHRITFWLLP